MGCCANGNSLPPADAAAFASGEWKETLAIWWGLRAPRGRRGRRESAGAAAASRRSAGSDSLRYPAPCPRRHRNRSRFLVGFGRSSLLFLVGGGRDPANDRARRLPNLPCLQWQCRGRRVSCTMHASLACAAPGKMGTKSTEIAPRILQRHIFLSSEMLYVTTTNHQHIIPNRQREPNKSSVSFSFTANPTSTEFTNIERSF